MRGTPSWFEEPRIHVPTEVTYGSAITPGLKRSQTSKHAEHVSFGSAGDGFYRCELPKKHIAEKKWIEKDGYNLPSQFNCEKGVNYFF